MQQQNSLTMMVPAVIFAVIWGLMLTPLMTAESLCGQKAVVQEEVSWQLTNPVVVEAGQTRQNENGTLTTGYKVQATAAAVGAAPVRNGTFLLNATVFSPKEDMPGQKAGMHYVTGTWSITDDKAQARARQARHSAAKIQGRLDAELSFNPARTPGPVNAQVRLPMSPLGKWSRGEGSFSGNEKFAGEISVTLDRLPEVK